jgi:hypothetical protein
MKRITARCVLIVALLALLMGPSWAAPLAPAPPISTGQVNCYGPVLAQGSTPAYVAHLAFTYWIGQTLYPGGASDSVGTPPNADIIPQATYGAWAFDVNAAGVVSATSATLNTTGYSTAAKALAGIPDVASTKARLGTVVVTKSSGTFTGASTSLTASGVTATYASNPTIIYPAPTGVAALPYTIVLVPITASTTIWVSPLSTLTSSTAGTPLSTTGITGAVFDAHPSETWYCSSASAATLGFTVH